ncbi:MAG: tetratricopeptide repeat protein [Candidatus Sericytochromatia bacterium]|nr:tetratricopeptide repeat protein [Candidatus Sericytochromatia bacterium]
MEINNKKQLSQTSKVDTDASKKKDATFYYLRGISNYNSDNKEEAEQDFNQSVELGQDNCIAYFNRGTFYFNEKKYKNAIDDFTRAVRLNHKFAEAYYNLACSYVCILSFREGLANLKKAIKNEKSFAQRAIRDPDFININKMKEFTEIVTVA